MTVHEDAIPETTVVGEQDKLVSNTGACRERASDEELEPRVAVTVAVCGMVNEAAVATNVVVEAPDAAVTAAGTESAFALLFVRAIVAPPEGAAWLKVTAQVELAPELSALGEHAKLVTAVLGLVERVPLPGAGRLAEASSMTSTQSLPSGAVKLCEPLLGKDPIRVAAPVCGLYHQLFAVEDADVIFAMLIVFAVALPSEKYAIIVCPSVLRAATESVAPDPNPAVSTE